ncbi:hypothetical protein EDB85DRAFT_606103 [Lactarius pseudohatsudake]|nr:hypothetical protein EDB85DRAFT_606103 [Lactarius pseudohatsudake]
MSPMRLQMSIGSIRRTFYNPSLLYLFLIPSMDRTHLRHRHGPPCLPPRKDNPQASQNTGPDHLDVIPAAPAVGCRNLHVNCVIETVTAEDQSLDQPPSLVAPSESPIPPHPNTRPSHPADPAADLQMSFPPPAENGFAAADFVHAPPLGPTGMPPTCRSRCTSTDCRRSALRAPSVWIIVPRWGVA